MAWAGPARRPIGRSHTNGYSSGGRPPTTEDEFCRGSRHAPGFRKPSHTAPGCREARVSKNKLKLSDPTLPGASLLQQARSAVSLPLWPWVSPKLIREVFFVRKKNLLTLDDLLASVPHKHKEELAFDDEPKGREIL